MADAQPIKSLRALHAHEYHCWKSMRRRCGNPQDASYRYYGAKGITVCDRWRDSFESFLADMGLAPSPEHQIDRVNNDLGYCPNNCHWSTPTEQQANTDKVRFLTFRGVTLSIVDWGRILDLPVSTIRGRLDGMRLSVEDALTKPRQIQKHGPRKPHRQ